MLPTRVRAAVRLTTLWVKRHTDDWCVVKREIMAELENEHRALFSRRDERTHEVTHLNETESEIVALWKELTGVELKLRTLEERRQLVWWTPKVENRGGYRHGMRKLTARTFENDE